MDVRARRPPATHHGACPRPRITLAAPPMPRRASARRARAAAPRRPLARRRPPLCDAGRHGHRALHGHSRRRHGLRQLARQAALLVRARGAALARSLRSRARARARADGPCARGARSRGRFVQGTHSVIPCFEEAAGVMSPGESAELTCPAAYGYGDRQVGSIPPNSTLHFQLQLVKVSASPLRAPSARARWARAAPMRAPPCARRPAGRAAHLLVCADEGLRAGHACAPAADGRVWRRRRAAERRAGRGRGGVIRDAAAVHVSPPPWSGQTLASRI